MHAAEGLIVSACMHMHGMQSAMPIHANHGGHTWVVMVMYGLGRQLSLFSRPVGEYTGWSAYAVELNKMRIGLGRADRGCVFV